MKVIFNERINELKWQFEESEKVEILSLEIVDQSIDFLSRWIKFFPEESTWVQKEHSVPSLIIRLDCVVRHGVLHIYEVEERPAGIGIAACLNGQFESKLLILKEDWPLFKSLVSFDRKEHDDFLWLSSIELEEAERENYFLLVRAEPHEKEFHIFQDRSVSTLLSKGDKIYGERMGLWRTVSLDDFETLPWSEGFCLKPKQGSKCRGIQIWNPEFKNRRVGVSTKSQISKALREYGEMYLQEYIPPMSEEHNGKKLCKAYRIYFGYNPVLKSYECLGGIWIARPNLRIHGASDAIIGSIRLEED